MKEKFEGKVPPQEHEQKQEVDNLPFDEIRQDIKFAREGYDFQTERIRELLKYLKNDESLLGRIGASEKNIDVAEDMLKMMDRGEHSGGYPEFDFLLTVIDELEKK